MDDLEENENIDDDIAEGQEGESDDDIIERARALYEIDKSHWDGIFQKGRDDLNFLSDEESAQWDDKIYQDRTSSGKPTLTVDQLSQFVHQVANNIRMNTPSINPLPDGSGSSITTAKVLKGLIRKVEYLSRADVVYDTAATNAIKCSIGFALVDHDYCDDDTFNQQIVFKRVINPFLILMDSETMEGDGSDQNHCHILEPIRVSKFQKDYPDFEVASYDDDGSQKIYTADQKILIVQFFEKVITKKTITAQTVDGKTLTRTKDEVKIMRYRLSGKNVLSRTTFPGDYIPVVPFYGEEAWNDGERNLHSLIRKSKGAQQNFNYMQSSEAEVLLKQPMAPVMTPAGAIENYADDWKDPSKSMALRYDVFDSEGRELPRPERLNPPQPSAGFMSASNDALNNIKATMGLYSNNLGQQGQEVSGKAIDARKIQGDVATYHFGDNAVRSIAQIGRIFVSAAPEIYDTDRAIQILNEEDKPDSVGINGHLVEGQKETVDLRQGKYDVRVVTGNSYATIRQESAAFYADLIKTNPQMMLTCGDLMFENMDVAGAPAMAARMKKIIDKANPGLRDGEDDDQKNSDPEKTALQQNLQKAGQIIQGMQAQMADLQKQVDDKNGAIQAKTDIEMKKIEATSENNQIEAFLKLADIHVKDRANDITEENNAAKNAIASEGLDQNLLFSIMQKMEAFLNAQAAAAQPAAPATGLPGNQVDPSANNGGGNLAGVI